MLLSSDFRLWTYPPVFVPTFNIFFNIMVAFQEEELKGAVVLLFANKQVCVIGFYFLLLKYELTFLHNFLSNMFKIVSDAAEPYAFMDKNLISHADWFAGSSWCTR